MSDSLISQFKREYNAPIEEFRQVPNLTNRDAISSSRRWEGMLVYVVSEDTTYELRGGTDNTFWAEFTGITDAPADGSLYGRKDGAWDIIPESLPEAPENGNAYARKDGGWTAIDTGGSAIAKQNGAIFNDSTLDGVQSTGALVAGTLQSGSLDKDGDLFRMSFVITYGPGAGTSTIFVRIGSDNILVSNSSGGASTSTSRITFELIRTGGTTYKRFYNVERQGSPNYSGYATGGGADFSGPLQVGVRVTATDSGATATVRYYNTQILKAI